MSFTIFLNEKTPFLAIKAKTSNRRKIDFFPKGLTHGFGLKITIFSTFLFRHYRPGKCLLRYSRTRKRLSKLKKTKSTNIQKIDIFSNGLTNDFGPKMAIFPTFLFRQYRQGKCFLRYSRTKKRLSKL